MHPRKLKNLNIHIYPNLKKMRIDVKNVSHHKAPAFYYHKERTIYVSAKKCDEYLLAHELAHAIICNFFLVKPPANTQEILAIYCDSHLKDESVYVQKVLTRRK